MKLVIDIGNSLVKFAVFKQNEIVAIEQLKSFDLVDLDEMLKSYPKITAAIVSNVRDNLHLSEKEIKILHFDHLTPIPIQNKYKAQTTLGRDRLAAAVGAYDLFQNTNILVIDAGTSITYDFITDKSEYLGGGISPGIRMRLQALQSFTGKLPFVAPKMNDLPTLIGNTTEKSILSGVQNGVLSEVDGIIDQYSDRFSNLKIVVTGGDYKYFDKYLKNNIFAAPNLVLKGLNKILDFNEDL